VRAALTVSQRRACQALDLHRSAIRYPPAADADRAALVKRMRALALANPRYGYRRIAALLRAEGRRVNVKRVLRLWRAEGLKVPRRRRKRRRLGSSEGGTQRRRAARKNEVWSYDFVFDQTSDGRPLKVLPVVDEYTRECLAMVVGRSLTAADVVRTLAGLVAERGRPTYLRSDNGPEFIAAAVKGWLTNAGVATLYIEPGSPWENAYSESFNSRLRDELLDREVFGSLKEAEVLLAEHRRAYNHDRPHSSLGYVAPAVFASRCLPLDRASVRPVAGNK
jgi:transposase InsO family protein